MDSSYGSKALRYNIAENYFILGILFFFNLKFVKLKRMI